MFCAKCGTQINDSIGVCSLCGTAALGSVSPGGAAFAAPAETSAGLVIGAIVCSVLALIFVPPLLGGIGLYLGSRVRKTNDGLGTSLMWLAGGCLVVGMFIGALLFLA